MFEFCKQINSAANQRLTLVPNNNDKYSKKCIICFLLIERMEVYKNLEAYCVYNHTHTLCAYRSVFLSYPF